MLQLVNQFAQIKFKNNINYGKHMLPKMPAAPNTLLAAQQSNGHVIYFYQTLQHSWQY